MQVLTLWPFYKSPVNLTALGAMTKFIHGLPGDPAARCLACRAAVALPICKAAALPLGIMESVRLAIEQATGHFSGAPPY